MCFGTAAFDTATFQHAILYSEGRPFYSLSRDMIILCVG